jgi:hypothetical protein
VLKDVADDIGMHESTVSRVVNNKYMHTHRGLYEMRFFFHSGIASTQGGENVSSLTVKERIKKIVMAEDPGVPLSDAAIVKILKAEGLQIARRTVAESTGRSSRSPPPAAASRYSADPRERAMNLEIVGRHVEITPAMRDFALDKLRKLEKLLDGPWRSTSCSWWRSTGRWRRSR